MAAQLEPYRRRFAYHAWATRTLTGALTDDSEHERARALLAHVLAADLIWLRRLRGEYSGDLVLWPWLTAGQVRSLSHESAAGYPAYLAALPDAGLASSVRYTNMKGDAFETVVSDILEHVLLHGAYHRGQVADELRQCGTAVPGTDYIVWVRAGEPNA